MISFQQKSKILNTEATECRRVNHQTYPVTSVSPVFHAFRYAPMFSTIESANWLVRNFVAPSISRSKS
jgi:hypothetical protein